MNVKMTLVTANCSALLPLVTSFLLPERHSAMSLSTGTISTLHNLLLLFHDSFHYGTPYSASHAQAPFILHDTVVGHGKNVHL